MSAAPLTAPVIAAISTRSAGESKQIMSSFRQTFDVLYRTVGRTIDDPCTYCGLPSALYDHVPPLRWCEAQDRDTLDVTDLRRVPCCVECNTMLGGQVLPTLRQRRSYLLRRYRTRYAAYLRIPSWDADELAELSPTMADDIIRSARFAHGVKERMRWLRGL